MAAKQQQTLYDAYLSLPEAERFLVQIFSLLYEAASKEKALSCWVAAAAQQDEADRVNPPLKKEIKEQVQALIKLGLLVPRHGMGAYCHEKIVDLVVRDAVRMATFEPIAEAIALRFPISDRYPGGPPFFRNEAQFMREVRIAIYREDFAALKQLFDYIGQVYWKSTLTIADAVRQVLTNPLDIDWIDSLSDKFFEVGLTAILQSALSHCEPA
ncbi:MAG: hypothetical protein AAFN12_02645, partial [Cyanobacteria bacterium J06560_2]